MIAHQEPGKNSPIATRRYSTKQPQPIFAVPITIDNHPPFPTACGHVIQTICHLDA